MDDAGVYRLDGETALIQTVDFFTPIVDDPTTFGAISAANSLSDIYAMGGRPITALGIVCVPDNFDMDMLGEILRGGQMKAREAGVPVVGGHTVKAPELKFGLAVTGVAHPDRLVTNAGAQPGDRLYLTKPLGTGVISTAVKAEKCPPEVLDEAVEMMLTLNAAAAEAMLEAGATACTDITGFGLGGHGHQLALSSGVAIEIHPDALPTLTGAEDAIEQGLIPGGLVTNRKFLESWVSGKPSVGGRGELLYDPQTSGGLLISIPETATAALEKALAKRDVPVHQIGRVVEGRPGSITII